MMLDDLLVCPVCYGELLLREMRESGRGSCSQCQRMYTYRDGVFDFTTLPLPDAEVLEKWSLWEELQKNGVVSYTEEPELNLSVGQREDATAFASFCQLSGLVLDVGCGPQELPSYGVNFPGQLVGIDPLRGAGTRRFDFVQGLGEYLPFRTATFDRVLFATSLDHMLSPQRALAEARRVISPKGSVNIWFGEVSQSVDEVSESKSVVSETSGAPWRRRMRTAIGMVQQRDVLGIMRLLAVRVGLCQPSMPSGYMTKLKVPDGAVDHFHLFHLNWSMVEAWLEEVGLAIAEVSKVDDTINCFIRATPMVRSV